MNTLVCARFGPSLFLCLLLGPPQAQPSSESRTSSHLLVPDNHTDRTRKRVPERSREGVFEKGEGMRTLTPLSRESCTSETVQRNALTWDKASEVWNSGQIPTSLSAKQEECLVVLFTSSNLEEGGGVPCTRRGRGSRATKTQCSGMESPEDFSGGGEKDARRGRSSASGHPTHPIFTSNQLFFEFGGTQACRGIT